jgi:hypothetical protein
MAVSFTARLKRCPSRTGFSRRLVSHPEIRSFTPVPTSSAACLALVAGPPMTRRGSFLIRHKSCNCSALPGNRIVQIPTGQADKVFGTQPNPVTHSDRYNYTFLWKRAGLCSRVLQCGDAVPKESMEVM